MREICCRLLKNHQRLRSGSSGQSDRAREYLEGSEGEKGERSKPKVASEIINQPEGERVESPTDENWGMTLGRGKAKATRPSQESGIGARRRREQTILNYRRKGQGGRP